ncbi:MAG: heavy metal-binding domain-containing protein [Deltaproteobacteria bacterium]|nr:heavy metal-binding domain-containing protein [Deltaproteobacteria bacterium]
MDRLQRGFEMLVVMCPRCRKRMKVEKTAREADCACGYHFPPEELNLIRHLEEELDFETHTPTPAIEETLRPPIDTGGGQPPAEEFRSPAKRELEDFSDVREFLESSLSKTPAMKVPPCAFLIENIPESERDIVLKAVGEVLPEIDLEDVEWQISSGRIYLNVGSEAEAIQLTDRLKDLHCDLRFGFLEDAETALKKGAVSARSKEPAKAGKAKSAPRKTERRLGEEPSPRERKPPSEFILTTADAIPGYEIERYCGIVSAQETLKEELLLENLSAGIKLPTQYSEYTAAVARLEKKLKEQAVAKGADAVIAVSFSTTLLPPELEGPALVILATGTAVRAHPTIT